MGNILFDFSFHPFPCNLIEGIMGDLRSYYKLYGFLKKLRHFVFVLNKNRAKTHDSKKK